MKILYIERKGKMLNTLEKYHIYTLTTQRLQMNEVLAATYNPIYDTLMKINSNTHNPTHSTTPYPPPHPTILLCPPSILLSHFPFPSPSTNILRQ
jgi:hypothetical protein